MSDVNFMFLFKILVCVIGFLYGVYMVHKSWSISSDFGMRLLIAGYMQMLIALVVLSS